MSRRSRRLCYLGKLIAQPAHGQDVTGILRIRLYLSPDISDVHVRRADLAVEISVPELFHDLLSGVDPPGMGREGPENLELCGGQIDALLANPHLTPQKVDHEAGEHEPLIWSVHAPTPEMGPNSTHHL